MVKAVIGILGMILFLAGIFLSSSLISGQRLAATLDDEITAYGVIGEGPPPCTWEVSTPDKVMSESRSQAVMIETGNPHDENCLTALSITAPDFSISPGDEERVVELSPNSTGSLSWIITPRQPGTYEISVSDIINTKVFGINVKNLLGLSQVQAQLASMLGSLFGPMLTVPWWWDRMKKKRKEESTAHDSLSLG